MLVGWRSPGTTRRRPRIRKSVQLIRWTGRPAAIGHRRAASKVATIKQPRTRGGPGPMGRASSRGGTDAFQVAGGVQTVRGLMRAGAAPGARGDSAHGSQAPPRHGRGQSSG